MQLEFDENVDGFEASPDLRPSARGPASSKDGIVVPPSRSLDGEATGICRADKGALLRLYGGAFGRVGSCRVRRKFLA